MGLTGTQRINMILQELLRQELDASGQNSIFSGLPILITRNNKQKDLFNGDIGVILGNSEDGYQAVFSRGENFVPYPINNLPPFEPALAMTVHKSQGSEYNHVLLALPDNPNHRLFTREIIYTGLTRAKKSAIIYGSEDALQTAITNRIHRESGMDLWER